MRIPLHAATYESYIEVSETHAKLGVDGLKSGDKDLVIWDRDQQGFGVKVTRTSMKIYFASYHMMSGKQKKAAFSLHGMVTTEQAS